MESRFWNLIIIETRGLICSLKTAILQMIPFCTIGVADFDASIMIKRVFISHARLVNHLYRWYKEISRGYGNGYLKWISQFDKIDAMEYKPYGGYGNEAVMRISPLDDVALVSNLKKIHLIMLKLFVNSKYLHNLP